MPGLSSPGNQQNVLSKGLNRVRPESITLSLEQKFSADQKAEIAQLLAQAIADQETIANEKSESDAVFKGRLKTCDSQISELAKKYNKGCETKQVECKIRYDMPSVGKKSYYRIDTEDLIETRDMTVEERQETINFPPAAKAPKEPKPTPVAQPPKPADITFRYIQDVAATLVTLPAHEQSQAIREMAGKIAPILLAQGKIADRNGNTEIIATLEAAEDLVNAWLTGCALAAGEDNRTDAAGA
jgi:hypothetical protein